jgi:hypothetical protein
VVPVRRIPKTTSGKFQRHCWSRNTSMVPTSADLADAGTAARRATGVRRLDGKRDHAAAAVPSATQELDGRNSISNESLFDIGASSLKLVAHSRAHRAACGRGWSM